MSKRKAAEDAPDTDHASRERGTVLHDAHDAPVRALDLESGATSSSGTDTGDGLTSDSDNADHSPSDRNIISDTGD